MVKFESLKSPKFESLSRNQMNAIKGGEETPGGSKVIGTYNVARPIEQDINGKRVVTYHYIEVKRIRSWSGDDISGGTTCYENEEICEQ